MFDAFLGRGLGACFLFLVVGRLDSFGFLEGFLQGSCRIRARELPFPLDLRPRWMNSGRNASSELLARKQAIASIVWIFFEFEGRISRSVRRPGVSSLVRWIRAGKIRSWGLAAAMAGLGSPRCSKLAIFYSWISPALNLKLSWFSGAFLLLRFRIRQDSIGFLASPLGAASRSELSARSSRPTGFQ
jgi:hypothetical protein